MKYIKTSNVTPQVFLILYIAVCVPVCLSLFSCTCKCICVYRSVCLSVVCEFVGLWTCLSVCLSACLSTPVCPCTPSECLRAGCSHWLLPASQSTSDSVPSPRPYTGTRHLHSQTSLHRTKFLLSKSSTSSCSPSTFFFILVLWTLYVSFFLCHYYPT